MAASSAAYDLHDKKETYRRHGVREYIVWQIHENRLDWFILEDGAFLRLDADGEGLPEAASGSTPARSDKTT